MKEKIEEIKNRFKDKLTWNEPSDVFERALGKGSLWVCTNNANEVWDFFSKELSTLIQEERKDAVEGFVEWLYNNVPNTAIKAKDVAGYLESEGVKSNEKDDTTKMLDRTTDNKEYYDYTESLKESEGKK